MDARRPSWGRRWFELWRRTLTTRDCNERSIAQLAARILSKLEGETSRLFDDVRDVVAALTGDETPLALITNGASDTQRGKLEILGMRTGSNTIAISGELSIAKPYRRVVQPTAEGLQTAEENACHGGDDLAADIAGAPAAGMTAVCLNRLRPGRRQSDPEPHLRDCHAAHAEKGLSGFLMAQTEVRAHFGEDLGKVNAGFTRAV